MDWLFLTYAAGHQALPRGEEQRIGFRLAHLVGLPRVWVINAQGAYYPATQQLLADSLRAKR